MKLFFLRSHGSTGFRARSAERDKGSDREIILPVKTSIDTALARVESEYSGLKARLENVTASATFVAGTETDGYLHRDERDADRLREYESEMQRAQARLQQLSDVMTHLKFIRASFKTRFPEY